MIDQTAFPNVPSNNFWTSTRSQRDSTRAYRISFVDGTISSKEYTGDSYYVMCVR